MYTMELRHASRPVMIGVAAMSLVVGLSIYMWHEEHRPPLLELAVFSLRSGHSMLIRTPDDRRILVGGGASGNIVREISHELPFYSRRIDVLIVSSMQGREVSGLVDVIERYDIGELIVPRYTLASTGLASTTDAAYAALIDAARMRGVEMRELEQGEIAVIGQEPRAPYAPVILKALFPAPPDAFAYSKASPPELLFEMSYKSSRVLFLGTASKKVQRYIAKQIGLSSIVHNKSVLILSQNVAAATLSTDIVEAASPTHVVFDGPLKPRPTTTRNSVASKSKKAPTSDPLAAVLGDARLNTREGTVHIRTDGLCIQSCSGSR